MQNLQEYKSLNKNLINSYINHDEFFSVINVLREYNEMKDIIRYPENSVDYIKLMEKYFVILEKKIQRAKILVSEELNKIG